MNPKDFYWLVGLLEGEGSFIISKKGQERITLVSTDLDVVERVADLFGGTSVRINRSQNRLGKKIQYITALYSSRARILMEQLLPEMSHRRQERISRILSS